MKYRLNKFRVLTKSMDLMIYTHKITISKKRFPKKVRFSWVKRIQDCSFEIYSSIFNANEIKVENNEDRYKRKKLQDKGIKECKNLMNLIDISYQLNYINANTCEHWARMTRDVMYMTMGWQKKEV